MSQQYDELADPAAAASADTIDTSNHPEFFAYYEKQSESPAFIDRTLHLRGVLSSFYAAHHPGQKVDKLDVVDVGCGAGTQCILWAQAGHQVSGIDISKRLIDVGKDRMEKAGVAIDFRVGSGTKMPFSNEQFDICLVPELLEHVPDWRQILQECARVLKPNGMLYLSTTNAACPIQNEFTLPLYSWYPGFIKRICEQKSLTTHRHWVSYATYPAVHWFTIPGLSRELADMGFTCHDRFDIMVLSNKPKWLAWVVSRLIRPMKLFRYLAYFFTVSTLLVAFKKPWPPEVRGAVNYPKSPA